MENQAKIKDLDHDVHLVAHRLAPFSKKGLERLDEDMSATKIASSTAIEQAFVGASTLAEQKDAVVAAKGETGQDGARAFARVSAKLKTQIGSDAYESWFGRLKLVDLTTHQVRLSVPTAFLRSWINNHYFSLLSSLWREENPEILRVEIVVRGVRRSAMGVVAGSPDTADLATSLESKETSEGALPLSNQHGRHPNSSAQTRGNVKAALQAGEAFVSDGSSGVVRLAFGSPLDGRYSFDNFVEGSANRVALAAARSIAESGTGALRFNPLFIHAGVGLGKTHLLQAIARASLSRTRSSHTVYLTAEYFMWRFASAIRDHDTLAFKEQLRAIDLLIIDDMQFLQGKSIQNEFCHLLNSLLDSARQIVVAADRPAAELESLDMRVRSRLSGGVSLEMGSPDYAMRLEILRCRLKTARGDNPSLQIDDEILKHIARAISGSGRDLEGAFNQLLFRHSFEPNLSLDRIDEILGHLMRTGEARRIRIEEIQRLVARHYNVSKQDILSNRRTRAVVRPRQVAMYLSKLMTSRSLPEIGRSFGGRDHTTVLHAVRTVEGKMETDQKLAQELELLKRLLNEHPV